MRTGPPQATAFSYRLQGLVCSVGVGSRFTAETQQNILNGEVWFQVVFGEEDIVSPLGCPAGTLRGWMIGRMNERGWLVSFDSMARAEQSVVVPVPQGPDADPAVPSDREPVATVTIEDDEAAEATSFNFLARYLLLVFGTVAAVVLVAIERKHSIKLRDWLSPVLVLESVVLSLANLVFAVMLLDTFLARSGDSTIVQVVSVFAGQPIGFLFLGFVLSILLLRSFSFSTRR